MRKFAFVLSGLAALAITLFVSSTSAIEEPTYSLVAQWDDPDVEIRDYDARILATTQMNEGQNSGFRVLAGYIFGGNESEHGGHIGPDHARALDDPCQRDRHATEIEPSGQPLRNDVGGHDGARRGQPVLIGHRFYAAGQRLLEPGHGQLLSDYAGGERHDLQRGCGPDARAHCGAPRRFADSASMMP